MPVGHPDTKMTAKSGQALPSTMNGWWMTRWGSGAVRFRVRGTDADLTICTLDEVFGIPRKLAPLHFVRGGEWAFCMRPLSGILGSSPQQDLYVYLARRGRSLRPIAPRNDKTTPLP